MPGADNSPGHPATPDHDDNLGQVDLLRHRKMSGPLSFFKSIKYSEAGLGMIVLACVLTVDMIPNGPLRAGRNWLFDTYQVLYPAQHDTSPVVVVEIDDQSIRHIGPWPWPRDRLAMLVSNAKGA